MAQRKSERDEVTFEIVAHLGVLAEKKDGWTKELNLVSWNGGNPPKFDIRDWSPDHKSMTKGVTLFEPEMRKAGKMFQDFCNAKRVAENRDKRNAAAEAGMRAGEEERSREEEPAGEAEDQMREAEKAFEFEKAHEESSMHDEADMPPEKDLAGAMAAAGQAEFAAEEAEAPF